MIFLPKKTEDVSWAVGGMSTYGYEIESYVGIKSLINFPKIVVKCGFPKRGKEKTHCDGLPPCDNTELSYEPVPSENMCIGMAIRRVIKGVPIKLISNKCKTCSGDLHKIGDDTYRGFPDDNALVYFEKPKTPNGPDTEEDRKKITNVNSLEIVKYCISKYGGILNVPHCQTDEYYNVFIGHEDTGDHYLIYGNETRVSIMHKLCDVFTEEVVDLDKHHFICNLGFYGNNNNEVYDICIQDNSLTDYLLFGNVVFGKGEDGYHPELASNHTPIHPDFNKITEYLINYQGSPEQPKCSCSKFHYKWQTIDFDNNSDSESDDEEDSNKKNPFFYRNLYCECDLPIFESAIPYK
ncbi:hypothetical protein CONCODRAFT_7336 [Conidiobolus coronatus NRRL 28638]|uniref:Uncharacterized protein n=1 Tax=Conidiobolus coronatus (strain ATCC 28846 / CBS 209.66 / NRRL 28638) TaxID=796925 RepID=A0A137P509_CONC2|nr:hypothetical protein CONCODRAFT_7336 [Conidiobolus coronatus NRRL 28638]|eukprot:KXN70100.1 hypothetical protein CONCODRAFT_7336 [Conidiobolus coronatus NRRL 28638]